MPSGAHLRFELVATRPLESSQDSKTFNHFGRFCWSVESWNVLNLLWNSRSLVGFDILKTSLLPFSCKTNAKEPMQGVHQRAPEWLWNWEYQLQIAKMCQPSGYSTRDTQYHIPFMSWCKAWHLQRDACRRSRLSGGKVSWHGIGFQVQSQDINSESHEVAILRLWTEICYVYIYIYIEYE